jgi:hypothetical protein
MANSGIKHRLSLSGVVKHDDILKIHNPRSLEFPMVIHDENFTNFQWLLMMKTSHLLLIFLILYGMNI